MKGTKRERKSAIRLVMGLALIMAVIGALAFEAWAQPAAAPGSDDDIIKQATALNEAEKFEESNKLLLELAAKNPNHPDVYWKIGQNFYDMGERIDIAKDKAKKLEMYQKCEEYAKKGFDKNPGLADNAFWMAVGKSQIAQTNGVAKTLMTDRKLAAEIEKYYIASTQAKEFHYRDTNADTVSSGYFALGQFYRKIPGGTVVKLLMGTAGDPDKSVENSKKALALYPKNIEYNKETGVSLLCRGTKNKNDADIQEAKKFLQTATELTPENALDKIDQTDAKKLMADPALACGYSRVQQEEVSEDSLKKEEKK